MKIIPLILAALALELIFPTKCFGIILLEKFLWASPYLLAIILTCGLGFDEIDRNQF